MKKSLLILLLISLNVTQVSAQYVGAYEINEGNCDFFIKDKNWPEGVKCFKELLKEKPNNIEYKYKIAQGYTYSNINKKVGLQLLLELDSSGFTSKDFKSDLAMAYFYNYKFDQAKSLFTKLGKEDIEEKAKYDKLIKQCDVGKQMISNPVAVSFENLGKDVNSKGPDFFPIVNPDESNIYFTTKRDGVVGNIGSSEGYKTADIFYVKHKRNKYSRARSIGSPNTLGNEFATGKSENGEFLIYTVNNEAFYYDLFISELGRRSYMAAKPINKDELKKSTEQGASLTNDGQVLYFSSDLEGGKGGFDIYSMRKLPNGNWGHPKNLGATINTEGNEMFPLIMDEGQTLYFSSDSHIGMGGMDLFKASSTLDGGWKKPINLGYPINTTSDDLNISFAKNHRYAYMAKRYDDTFGDLDIYRLTFQDKKDDYTLLTGRVLDQDSVVVEANVNVEVFDDETGNIMGTYIKNKSGKYSAILAPGKYSIEVNDVEGYANFKKSIVILGKNDHAHMRKWDIIIQRQ